MKRVFAITLAVLALLASAMVYNIWRASQEPITRTPSPLETGRIRLHQQLEEAKNTEAQVEKQAWESAPALRRLMKAHEQRMEKLKENSQAGEILAYDEESIGRLEKRITELAAREAVQAAADESQANPGVDSQSNSRVLSKAGPPVESKPKAPAESKPKPAENSQP